MKKWLDKIVTWVNGENGQLFRAEIAGRQLSVIHYKCFAWWPRLVEDSRTPAGSRMLFFRPYHLLVYSPTSEWPADGSNKLSYRRMTAADYFVIGLTMNSL